MKVKDTLTIDKVYATLQDKVLNFLRDRVRHADNTNSTHYIRQNFPSWQYNGAEKFNNIIIWCEENFGNDFVWYFETIYFKYDRDRTAFMLRWQ